MNPIRQVIKHPAIAGALGTAIGWRFAAMNAAERGAGKDEAVAAAIKAGKACMTGGPLLTGTVSPAGEPAAPPPPRPPSNAARIVVFIVSVVIGAVIAARLMGGHFG